jgi:peptidyl-prolyl cis-trans isomerase A (cyclophilin A)
MQEESREQALLPAIACDSLSAGDDLPMKFTSLVLLAVFGPAAFSQTTPTQTATPQTTAPQTTSQPAASQDLPDAPSTVVHAKAAPEPTGPTIVIDSSMGRMVCKLFDKIAPVASANFVGLAEGSNDWVDATTQKKIHHQPFYNGVTFHRVIPGFMIQGGDRLGTGTGDAGYLFANEADPSLNFDVAGRLAMANAGPGPNGSGTNGSQFFITEVPYPDLNGGYTIFGQCDEHSVLVVASIARVDRDAQDKPREAVTIKKVTVVREGQPMPPPPAETAASTPSK